MPDVPIGRDEDFNRLWNAATSERCTECRHYLPSGVDFGKGKHAVVDKMSGKLSVLCDDCYDDIMHIVRGKPSSGKTYLKDHVERLRPRAGSKKKISLDEEDEEEDDEEEDEDDSEDEFSNFFKSFAGRAVKIMFKNINRRLDKLEKRFLRD